MTTTTAIVVSAVLAAGLVAAMLWLLGHHGIRKGVGHDLKLLRRRIEPATARFERDADRDLAA